VQRIKSCRRQLRPPKKLTLRARLLIWNDWRWLPFIRAAGVDTWDAERTLRMFGSNLKRFEEHRDTLKRKSRHCCHDRPNEKGCPTLVLASRRIAPAARKTHTSAKCEEVRRRKYFLSAGPNGTSAAANLCLRRSGCAQPAGRICSGHEQCFRSRT
jgi:hypothetical protein